MITIFKQIEKNEKNFSINNYNGAAEEDYKIIKGNIPIILSAPHSVNHFRNGQKKSVDLFTGGIAMCLQQLTGCHLIYNARFSEKDPNFDLSENNEYQLMLKKYLHQQKQNNQQIHVLLDLHGASSKREYAVELGTAPALNLSEKEKAADLTSLHNHKFIEDIIIDTFTQNFSQLNTQKKSVWKNKIFAANSANTVTKNISENTDTDCLQLEINGEFRIPSNREQFTALIKSLRQIIEKLAAIDWASVK